MLLMYCKVQCLPDQIDLAGSGTQSYFFVHFPQKSRRPQCALLRFEALIGKLDQEEN